MRTRILPLAAFCLLGLSSLFACDNGAITDVPSDGTSPYTVEAISPTNQSLSLLMGSAEVAPLQVRVTKTKNGKPAEGVQVHWALGEGSVGDLSVETPLTQTDSAGIVRAFLTTGSTAGPATVEAHVEGYVDEKIVFSFALLPGGPHQFDVGTEERIGQPGTLLNPSAQLLDAHGNALVGVPVTWSGPPGVVLPPSQDTTDANGMVSRVIQLPSEAGIFQITLTAGSLSKTFEVRGADLSVQVISGDGQTGEVGLPLPEALVIHVQDDLDLSDAAGIIVNWTLEGAVEGTLDQTSTLTDAQGQSSYVPTLGAILGAYTVTASTGTDSVTFSASAAGPGGATQWQRIGQDLRYGQAQSAFAAPLTVRVLDSRGVPVAGVDVNWHIASGSYGSIDAASSQTDASGIASMNGTFPQTLQDTLIIVASTSFFTDSISFRAISTSSGTPVALEMPVVGAGEGQEGPAGQALPLPLKVRVLDVDRHPVDGVEVKWRVVNASHQACFNCGTLGQTGNVTAISFTDSDGIAQVQWELGPVGGPQYVEAYVPEMVGDPDEEETVMFTAFATSINVPDDMMKAYPDLRLSGIRGNELVEDLSVVVVDSVRSPVAGVPVSWAVTSGDGVIRYATTTTDDQGIATNRFVVGHVATNHVTASVARIGQSIVFQVRGTKEPSRIILLAGDNQSEVADSVAIEAGITFNTPLSVQVTDEDGLPVKYAQVVFTAVQGGGGVSVDGSSFPQTLTVLTDYDGYAIVRRQADMLGEIKTSASILGTFASVLFHALIQSP